LCYVLPADSGQLPDCVIRAAGQDEVTSPSNICSGNAFKPTWHGMGSMAMGASPAPEDALLTNLAVKTGG